jgi:hypothetical protein
MNNPVPLEYVTSFAQTNQALMQHLDGRQYNGHNDRADSVVCYDDEPRPGAWSLLRQFIGMKRPGIMDYGNC